MKEKTEHRRHEPPLSVQKLIKSRQSFLFLGACLLAGSASISTPSSQSAKPAHPSLPVVPPSIPAITADLVWSPDANGWRVFERLDILREVFRGRLTLRLFYWLEEDAQKNIAARGGPEELEEIKRQLLLATVRPQDFRIYMRCRAAAPNAQACLSVLGIDPAFFEMHRARLPALLKSHVAATAKVKPLQPPILLIDGIPYADVWDIDILASYLNSRMPKEAQLRTVPPYQELAKRVPPLKVRVIAEPGGWKARDKNVEAFLAQYIPGVQWELVPSDSPEAQGMIKRLNLAFLPAYLTFAPPKGHPLNNLENSGFFDKAQGYWVVKGAGRRGVYRGASQKPKTLDVFVMSQCPFGILVENQFIQGFRDKKIPNDVKVDIHYIARKMGPGQFQSLHGQGEWEEDARQLVIKKHFPEKFHAYLLGRNKAPASSFWDDAARAAGIDMAKLRDLYNREGLALLEQDIALANEKGIGASPTFVWENTVLIPSKSDLAELPEFAAMAPVFKTEQASGACQ